MSPEQKEKALLRYFASEDYIRRFHDNYENFWQNLIKAIDFFENNLPEDYDTWEDKEKIDIWRERVLTRHTSKDRFETEIQKYLKGEPNILKGIAHNYGVLMTRIWDLMVMKWLDYIDPKYKRDWLDSYKAGGKQSGNIYYTLADFWDNGEILDEEITGLIDEKVLQKYVK